MKKILLKKNSFHFLKPSRNLILKSLNTKSKRIHFSTSKSERNDEMKVKVIEEKGLLNGIKKFFSKENIMIDDQNYNRWKVVACKKKFKSTPFFFLFFI